MVELAKAMGKRSIDILIAYLNGEDIEGHYSHCQTVMKAKERLLTYSGVGKCTKKRAVAGAERQMYNVYQKEGRRRGREAKEVSLQCQI